MLCFSDYFFRAPDIRVGQPACHQALLSGQSAHASTELFTACEQGLLVTFMFSIVPTMQFLHTQAECGPYQSAASPYQVPPPLTCCQLRPLVVVQYFVAQVDHLPASAASAIQFAANPSTTWALLAVSVISWLYSRKMFLVSLN